MRWAIAATVSITLAFGKQTETLESARAAAEQLGVETWSRVVAIRSARSKKLIYALVFEFAGLLWFYDPREGTQSFSRHIGRLEKEKGDFAPLMAGIDPAFVSWEVLPTDAHEARRDGGRALLNGCFIESVLAARTLAERGWVVRRSSLLMYYSPVRKAGHCVLVYQTNTGVFAIDPLKGGGPIWISATWPDQVVELAKLTMAEQRNDQVNSARLLPFTLEAVMLANVKRGEVG